MPDSECVEDDETDLLDALDGVETERSNEGQPPKASEGTALGEGDTGRTRGDVDKASMRITVVVSVVVHQVERWRYKSSTSADSWAFSFVFDQAI